MVDQLKQTKKLTRGQRNALTKLGYKEDFETLKYLKENADVVVFVRADGSKLEISKGEYSRVR